MLPWGLIFKLSPEPMKSLPQAAIDADRKFWDDYAARLLADPKFRLDADASVTFAKLAAWHADLYHYRGLLAEEEHWLRLAISLCPQAQDSVSNLSRLLAVHNHFDEAITLVKKAQVADPRTDLYGPILLGLQEGKILAGEEKDVRDKLARSAYDVSLNLELGRILDAEAKFPELDDQMRFVAGLTNWDRTGMAGIVQYYVDHAHNTPAAIAFLEARAKLDPRADQLIYSLAALEASIGRKDDALKYLAQAASVGGTNVFTSAKIDPRFSNLAGDPRFQALLNSNPVLTNSAPPNPSIRVNAPPQSPKAPAKKPSAKSVKSSRSTSKPKH
jgi:tetratricopeptide (TPR) repeat protein